MAAEWKHRWVTIANDKLFHAGGQHVPGGQLNQLHPRRDSKAVSSGKTPAIDWEWMTILLMQMQEHIETLSRQDDISGDGKKALSGLDSCANELLPVLLSEARRH